MQTEASASLSCPAPSAGWAVWGCPLCSVLFSGRRCVRRGGWVLVVLPLHPGPMTQGVAGALAALHPAPDPSANTPSDTAAAGDASFPALPASVALTYTLFPVVDDGSGGALGCLDASPPPSLLPPRPAATDDAAASLRAMVAEWELSLRLAATEAVARARTEQAFDVIRESGPAAPGTVGGPIGDWEAAAAAEAASAAARRLELLPDGGDDEAMGAGEGGGGGSVEYSLATAEEEVSAEAKTARGECAGTAGDALRVLAAAGSSGASSLPALVSLTLRTQSVHQQQPGAPARPKANAGALDDLRTACAVLQVRLRGRGSVVVWGYVCVRWVRSITAPHPPFAGPRARRPRRGARGVPARAPAPRRRRHGHDPCRLPRPRPRLHRRRPLRGGARPLHGCRAGA